MAVPSEVKRIHGRWGELYIKGQPVLEAVGIEYTVEIDQQEVPQVGGQWLDFTEGQVRGSGTLRIVKAYSSFEKLFFDFVSKSPDDLRALRDSGVNPRPTMTLSVILDDPLAYGREEDVLYGVKIWSYTGGFANTDLVNRDWPFTFRQIVHGSDNGTILGSPVYLTD